MKMRKSVPLYTAAGLLLAVSAQAADIISVNWSDGAMSSDALVQGTYGVEPAANWNNIVNGMDNLTNASGIATTVDVTAVRPNFNSLWPTAYSNTVLRAGIRENLNAATRSSVTLTELNANFPFGYKLIVYLNGASAMNAASVTDGTTTIFYKTLFTPGNFTGALTETADEDYDGTSPSVPVAQYAVFGTDSAPLTEDSITLTMDALLGNAGSLCALQIVAAEQPELPEGTVFYDDFSTIATPSLGRVLPTNLIPNDWSVVSGNVWDGTASKYYRYEFAAQFNSTNSKSINSAWFDAPADSTGGAAAKIGYINAGSSSFEVLTINTGIKFNANTNYTVKIRAKVKNKNNNTTNDPTAVGQIRLFAGYLNNGSNFVSNTSFVDTLNATNWTEVSVAMNGARVSTNATDLIVRLARQNFNNTADYFSWVDYIQVDASSPVDDWLASQGLTNASWTADADGDGIDNFTEYATGGDPNDSDSTGFSGPSFIVDVGGGTNRFAYVTPRQADYWANGVDYFLQRKTDLLLGDWVGAGTWIKGIETGGYAAEFDAVTNYLGNIESNDTQFLRLRVTHPSYNP